MLIHIPGQPVSSLLAPVGLTVGVVVTLAAVAWWLYRSPARVKPLTVRGGPDRASWFVTPLLTLGAAMLVTGSWWDASMHVRTGEIPAGADFLWPPHLLIYASFLLTLVVGGLALLAAGQRAGSSWHDTLKDPRPAVRAEPLLGGICLAACYVLVAIPADALWHEVVGVDLTAWSPPHILLAAASVAVMVLAAAHAVLNRGAAAGNHGHSTEGLPRGRARGPGAIVLPTVLLGLALGVLHLLAAIEWELPGAASSVAAARPDWLYPVVAGGVAAFMLAVSRRLLPMPWAATVVALVFYGSRLGVTVLLAATGNPVPHVPVIFLFGAILLDVRNRPPQATSAVIDGTLFALATLAATMPMFASRDDLQFPLADWPLLIAGLTVVSVVSIYIADRLVARLVGPSGVDVAVEDLASDVGLANAP